MLNPTLVVEVLSASTADYDRGAKFEHYRTVPSLREVLFVAQHEFHVVRYSRRDDATWILSETRDPEATVPLASIEAELHLPIVYAKVELDRPAAAGGPPLEPGPRRACEAPASSTI